MSSQTTATQTQNQSRQNRRGDRRNRSGKPKSEGNPNPSVNARSEEFGTPVGTINATLNDAPLSQSDDADVCWICAEPVKYYSVSTCNHRTCHVCAVRLRALYKKQDCTFCKSVQLALVFTKSADVLYETFDLEAMQFKDARLSIYFETEEMRDETLILLKFNCPDTTCVYVATAGWNDLKLHVRSTHGKLMCELCIKFKKVFAHEHALYTPNQLPLHLPSLSHRLHKNPPKDVEGGVHPLCEFCRECYFSGDELFAHMRERHEECFVCKRAAVRDVHFKDYPALELHFKHAHHLCQSSACLAQKFVVFGSIIDLQAHIVEVHGNEMTPKDRREALRVQADFEFQEVGGSNRRGRRDRGDREREREPPPIPMGATPGTTGRRREAFSTALTAEPSSGSTGPASNTMGPPSRRGTPSPPRQRQDVDPAVAQRHNDFMRRLDSLLPNSPAAVTAVKAAIRSFRGSESGPKDLVSTCWNVMDQDLDKTASIVVGVVDLFDDEDKKNHLLEAWNGFKVEQRRQFPELVPSITPGYSNAVNGLVLSAKHSTNTRSRPSDQVWDRVAQAASSSSPLPSTSRVPPPPKFPPLPTSGQGALSRQSPRTTPWAGSSATTRPAMTPSTTPIAVSQNVSNGPNRPSTLSKNEFPGLPTNQNALPKGLFSGNKSVKNIVGEAAPSVWSTGGEPGDEEDRSAHDDTGGKKKSKGKQKQTLFTMGAFRG